MYDLRDPSCMKHAKGMPAGQALERLKEGNRRFLVSEKGSGDVSPSRRRETEELGQHPYAVVVTCSDSRVVPESIFSAGIGDLFVIRSAGNIVDGCTLGSIEYAVEPHALRGRGRRPRRVGRRACGTHTGRGPRRDR